MTPEPHSQPPLCPACGADRTLRIVYGYPSPALEEQFRQGKVMLGGCMVYREAPVWHCAACGHQWGRLAEETPGYFAD